MSSSKINVNDILHVKLWLQASLRSRPAHPWIFESGVGLGTLLTHWLQEFSMGFQWVQWGFYVLQVFSAGDVFTTLALRLHVDVFVTTFFWWHRPRTSKRSSMWDTATIWPKRLSFQCVVSHFNFVHFSFGSLHFRCLGGFCMSDCLQCWLWRRVTRGLFALRVGIP